MTKFSIRHLNLHGKRVFIRADLNAPLNKHGEIVDDSRLRGFLPTLQMALGQGARVIVGSHLGRPQGRPDPKMSLWGVSRRLSEILGSSVKFTSDCVGNKAIKAIKALKIRDTLLLENLRFYPGEEKNDISFAAKLASLSDIYINDAFGAAHRAHASIEALARLSSVAAVGLLMEKELNYLGKATHDQARPYVLVVGGSKVSSKIHPLQKLIPLTDQVLIGGAMAYTFLKAQGKGIGSSIVEEDKIDQVKEILVKAQQLNIDIKLPSDHIVSSQVNASANPQISSNIPDGLIGVDIGPSTCKKYAKAIGKAGTVVWNGPMGVYELDQFSQGTMKIATAIASSSAISIAGGGDSIAAIAKTGVGSKISHISTGGGASLEFLAGIRLPGVDALPDR